jgi:hypothetical protein
MYTRLGEKTPRHGCLTSNRESIIGKYLSSLGKLDDIVAPEEGFEAQL